MPDAPNKLPYAFAKRAGVAVMGESDGVMRVALREGADRHALIEVRRYLARSFTVETSSSREFDRLLSERYALDDEAARDAAGSLSVGLDLHHLAAGLPATEDLLDTSDDAPAIKLINGIIADAARRGGSDVHIEPYEGALVVRVRVDGVLGEVLRMGPHAAPVIVSRIKVMARLDIAERRVPQDGRIALSLAGKQLDVRVSTLPSRAGERVVLRILNKENADIDLDVLGMPPDVNRLFRGALAEPNGIVLITGPTGSGKTTSLYAGLRLLNNGSRNILTVEDPVEYAIDGVGQTQVNDKVGLNFATGLRAILRQDPDVVMVGEIRDRETAQIAVQASLTGHLVLSTVHTNDAVGAITRLRDMKIEPFLIASTLRAVIAQRLVRRICPSCKGADLADPAADLLNISVGTLVYKGQGCDDCGRTGYKGRIGVFEAIRVDDMVKQLVNSDADETAIASHVFRDSPTLTRAVRALVLKGVTSVEEAVRVSGRGDGDD